MPGTYNGTDFGGATTWWESVTGRTDAQRKQAERNISAAAGRSGGKVVSADGERVYQVRRGTGPGNGAVGTAPTTGPGQSASGGAVTSGPGVRAVRVGAAVGAGSGNWRVGTPEKTTAIFVSGREIPRDEGTSDGADFEDRWGEWGGGLAGLWVMGADGVKATSFQGDKAAEDLGKLPELGWEFLRYVDSRGEEIRSEKARREVKASRRDGLGGAVYFTGGGF